MATITIDVIKLKRGVVANIPVLTDGEPFYATDTRQLWIGTTSGNVPLNVDLTNYYTKTETDNIISVAVDAEETARIAADNNLLSMIQQNDIVVYSSTQLTIEDFIANDPNALLMNNNDIVILSNGNGYIYSAALGANTDPLAYTQFSVVINMVNYYTKTEIDSKVSNLQGQIDINETNIATNTAAIATHTTEISTLNTNVSSLQTNKADLTYVNTQDNALDARIGTLETNVYVVDGGIV